MKSRGFTLVELMITVAIIGILAMIAVPQYSDYLSKSRRSDGMTALLNMAALQERFYVQNNTYAGDGNISQVGGSTTSEGFYTIKISSASTTAFLLTATAISEQVGDTDCATMTLSSTGAKLPVGCW